MQTDLFKSDRQ